MTDLEVLREFYQTHIMEYDGLAQYGWNPEPVDEGNRCRVCRESIITIVDAGAICRECRLTGGYNSQRYAK